MNEYIILYLVASVLPIAYICHEIGHFFIFKALLKGKDAVIWYSSELKETRIGFVDDYKNFSSIQLLNIYLMGILFGLIPIVYLSDFISKWFGLFIIPYLWFSRGDLYNVFKTMQKVFKGI